MNIAAWWNLGILLLLAVMLHVTPRLTRPELFFGITVRRDFRDSPAGRGLTRIYRFQIWALAAIGTVVVLAGRGWNPGVVCSTALWVLVVGGFFAWYLVHRMTRRHAMAPSSEREAVLTLGDRRAPGRWFVKLGPFLMLGAVALYLHLNYNSLPDPYPVHWNFQGVANRFVSKSPAAVFRLPTMGLAICCGLMLTAFSLARHSKHISISGVEGEHESRFRRMNLMILLGVQYYVAFMFAWLAVAYRAPNAMPFAHYALLIMSILPIPFALYFSIRYGQGGSRLGDRPAEVLGIASKSASASESSPTGDRTPDECWKWGGMIYYNPDDAAIWIEKRFGVGYTVNLARPLAWAILLTILLVPWLVTQLMR